MSPDSKNEYIERIYCECDKFYEDIEKKEETVKNILKEGQSILSHLNTAVENEEHFSETNNKLLAKTIKFSNFTSTSYDFINPLMEATANSLTAKENTLTNKYIPKCKEIRNSMKKFLQFAVSPKIEESRILYNKSKESWYAKLLEMFQSSTINSSDEIEKIRKSYTKNATNYYFKMEQIQELILSILVDHILQIDSYLNTRCSQDSSELGSQTPDISKLYNELQEKIKENIKSLNKVQDDDKDIKNLQNILKSDLIHNDGYVQVEIDNTGEKHLAYILYDDTLKSISIRFVDGVQTKVQKFTIDSTKRDENTCLIKVNSGKTIICLTCLNTTSVENWANILCSKEKITSSSTSDRQTFPYHQEKEIKSKEKNFVPNEVYTKCFSHTFMSKLISIVMKSSNTIGLYEKKSTNSKTLEFIQKAIESKNMDDISPLDASDAIKTILINNSRLIDNYLYMQYKALAVSDDLMEIRKIINTLSLDKLQILEMLINHFNCLLTFDDQNQLDATKLSSIFGPILIEKNNKEDSSEDSKKMAEFVQKLIVEYPYLFKTTKSFEDEGDELNQARKEYGIEPKKDHDENKSFVAKFKKGGFIANLASKLKKDRNKNENDKTKEKKNISRHSWRKNKNEDNKKETAGNEEICRNSIIRDKNENKSSSEDDIKDEDELINQNLDNEIKEKQIVEKENDDHQNLEKKDDDKTTKDLNLNDKQTSKNENEEVSIKTEDLQKNESSLQYKDVSIPESKVEFENRDFAVLGTNMKRPMARGNLARNPKATLNFVSEKNNEEIRKSLTVQQKEPKEIKAKVLPEVKKRQSNYAFGEKVENKLQDNFKIPPFKNSLAEKIDNTVVKNEPSSELPIDKIRGKNMESTERYNESSQEKEKEFNKESEEFSNNKDNSRQLNDGNGSKTKNVEKGDDDQANNKNAEENKEKEIKKDKNTKNVYEENKKEQGKTNDVSAASLKDIFETSKVKTQIEIKESDNKEKKDEENENEKKPSDMIKARKFESVGFKLPTFTKKFNLKAVGSKSTEDQIDKEETFKKEISFIPPLKKVEKKSENSKNDEKEVSPENIYEKDRAKWRTASEKVLHTKALENEVLSNLQENLEVKRSVPTIPKKNKIEQIPESDDSNELMKKLSKRRVSIQQEENSIEAEAKISDSKENAKQISNSTETVEVNNSAKTTPKPTFPKKFPFESKPEIQSENLTSSSDSNIMKTDNKIYSKNQKDFFLPAKKEIPEIYKRK